MEKLQAIKSKLETSQKIAIFGHENIDWDSLWSMLWLGEILENLWKQVEYYTPDKPAKNLIEATNTSKIKTEFNYDVFDLIIFVDFHELIRIKKFSENKEKYFEDNFLMIFDHHEQSGPDISKLSIIDSESQSTCGIIFEIIKEIFPNSVNETIANNLFLGIMTDTWNFLYWNNKRTIRSMQNWLELLKLWADKERLVDIIFYRQAPEIIQIQWKLSQRSKQEWEILYTYYEVDEIQELWLDKEQVKAIFSDTFKRIYWPKLFILFRKEWNEIKWSLRTWTSPDKKIDCQKLARELFGWWWHKESSWFTVISTLDIKLEIKQIINKIHNYLLNN